MSMCAKVFRRHWKIFLGMTVFVGIFSAVYEYFGHGVMSDSMIYAFLYPLILGVMPMIALAYLDSMKKIAYGGMIRVGINLFYSGIATLTVGSLATGVVEIYGTTNRLLKYYFYTGLLLLVIGSIILAVFLARAVNQYGREK